MGDNQSSRSHPVFHQRIATLSHSAILLSIFVIGMISLEVVLKPFFIALGIYFVLKPGGDILSKNGFPVFLSYLTMLLLFVLILTSTAFFAWSQAQDLADDTSRQAEYNEKLDERWNKLKNLPIIGPAIKEAVKDGTGTLGGDLEDLGVGSGGQVTDIVVSMVSGVGSLLTTGVTVLFFLIFIIFEAHLLPDRIERAWPGGASERVEIVRQQIQESVNTYVVVKTGCGLGSAFIAGAIMWAFGIDLWFVWAVMTFVMNYVPYIGSLIATIPPLILGLILLKPLGLVVMALMLLANQQIWGNYIETKWAGRALDLSPVILLLVTAFSFWLWGITGMILAVPLIVIVKIVLENIEETRPIAILLSERAPTLDEAWRDALRDGIVSAGESHKLDELRKMLGVSESEVVTIAGRSAVHTALKRNRILRGEIDFIVEAARGTHLENQITMKLKVGRLVKEMRPLLIDLVEELDSPSEEE
ncbi:MAG: AI-2E family transporter [Candidatus Poseidoniaceae archaeon]|jgi:predicted PurR-regulated permease PerM|nr:AI-2E family transporter [Candidatus Poseidoniaceae archaeon]